MLTELPPIPAPLTGNRKITAGATPRANFKAVLQAGAFPTHDKIFINVREAACLLHARRNILDLHKR